MSIYNIFKETKTPSSYTSYWDNIKKRLLEIPTIKFRMPKIDFSGFIFNHYLKDDIKDISSSKSSQKPAVLETICNDAYENSYDLVSSSKKLDPVSEKEY